MHRLTKVNVFLSSSIQEMPNPASTVLLETLLPLVENAAALIQPDMSNRIQAIVFDLGNTLIEQRSDLDQPLDRMELKLMPHVKSALELLRPHYRIGLLTDTGQSNADHVLAALRSLSIGDYFAAIVTSVDVGLRKPDLRMFEAVLRAMNVSPKYCVMVGNDFQRDIEPAVRIGMWTAYFSATAYEGDVNPDIHFSSFSDLPELLSELEVRLNDTY